ncbi:MAG: TonB-dependent receptor [Gemmatimonadetes bacterium]|jgi:hypothetical protein|nr:TonB-dependent receptor [Gemmatimonadota bacterium]
MTYGSRLFRVSLVLGIILTLSVSSSWAASAGKIAGVIKDSQTGDLLPNANVVLVDSKLGTVSDEEGRFFILNVPAGTYSLRTTYIGYNAYQVEEVRVSADLTTNLEIKMVSSDIQVEEVVIKAERPIIDQTATNAVRIIGAEDLEIMPFRGVQEAFALQAGVVEEEGNLHIRGSRSDEIGYYVEGASTRNVVSGGSAVGLIDEALSEIQVQAGGFNAEYGGANAGIIMHDLRTGGPEWKFSFGTETDNFTGDNEKRFGTYSYGYSNQVLTASGPVINQKTRAFIALQRSVENYDPVFWEGFEFGEAADEDPFIDTGDRGGGVHWQEDDAGHTIPDTINSIVLKPGNIDHTGNEQIDINSTLLFDLNPFQLRISGLYTTEDQEVNPQPVRNLFNQERLPESERTAKLLNIKGTHLLSPSMFYELNFSLYNQTLEIFDPVFGDNWWVYNDSAAVANELGYSNYSTNGSIPRSYDLNGFPFARPGTPTDFVAGWDRSSRYEDRDEGYWGLGGNLVKQTEVHQIKAGFDYQKWTSRRYRVGLSSLRSAIKNTYPELDAVYDRFYAGEISQGDILDEMIAKAETLPDGDGSKEDLVQLLRLNSAGNFFGYDVFGNQSDGEGLEAPRKPVMASAFLQDKIEYNDLIINAGLRYEYYYADSWRFLDQSAPVRDGENYTMVIEDEDGKYMQKTRKFHEFSPRLGFSFPVSDVTVFHAQYGRFSQMPAMTDMFTGGAGLAVEMGGQNYIRFPTAFDIEPIRTTQYEIGFEQQFTDFASFDITGFYRDVKGQLQIAKQELSTSAVDVGAFNYLQNGDFATTKGLEFVLKVRRVNRIRAEMNYTLSDARGTGSSVNSAISGVENDNNLPTVIAPLDFNETHRGNLYVDYRFGANEGGPVLKNAGANMLLKFTSGHNYTLSDGSLGQRGPEEGGLLADDDPRQRKPVESVNRSKTPWTFEIDLRLDKGFSLFGSEAQVYTYVQNLLNRKNEINVFSRTGNAEDDGFLTNPEMSGQIVEASGGLAYTQLYQAINLVNRQHYWYNQGGDILGEPRQIRFGLKFSL